MLKNMRSLKDILKESILDDIDTQIEKGADAIKDEIKSFLEENYTGTFKISDKPNKNGLYDVSSSKDVITKNKNMTSLTNGLFIWTIVNGDFICSRCESLKSLEGAPKEVDGDFDCASCKSLVSLDGAPEKVGNIFICVNCRSLKKLKGAPKEVGGNFYCFNCPSLKSLEGAPEKVGGEFYCDNQFTKDDVKKVSNVKGKIVC